MSMHFNYPAQFDHFFDDLVGGQIVGVRPRPARTRDVHALYCAWALKRGEPVCQAVPYLYANLVNRRGVKGAMKRYAVGDQVLGPHGVMYLVPIHQPPPGYERDWLGQELTAFQSAAETFISCQSTAIAARVE